MARTISLNGTWELTWFVEGTHVVDGPAALERLDTPRIPARVPGNVELDLVAAGLLPDPFIGDNIHRLRELEGCEWWYRTRFATPGGLEGSRVRLTFHGLDCLATVWLNGHRLGQTDNALVEHAFEVSGLLAPTDNELVVRLGSAVNAARGFEYPPICHAMVTNTESLYIRKAPHAYGWDIAPRAVSAGIWRDVALEAVAPTGIEELYFYTRHLSAERAVLGVHWRLRTEGAASDGMSLRFHGNCGDSEFVHAVPVRFAAGATDIEVTCPRAWWPRGYGAAELYQVDCELLRDGQVIDRHQQTVGLRTVELVRTDTTRPDEPGQFLLRVNGVPILCKGSNWVPADAFHSRDAGRYERMLALFADLECNILRCWGGNVYEDHAFFDLCDRLGILVWQDFAFACALYPQDDAFAARVRAEAEKVVRKLRNHPSLALWAGDNENDAFYLGQGLDPGGNRLTRQVLPEVCRQWDPRRPYLPSSPYVAPEVVRRGDQRLMPEQHLWGPRDFFKSRFYAENTAHFASEIGYHGCPNVGSVERFIEPPWRWPWQDNAQWRTHAADQVPEGGPYQYRIKLMAEQIGELFGLQPDSLEEFALASQISQAEAKKYFIELFRLRRWRTTGIIWWNVIDCWPQFSDAVVDYYFARKLAYWYIRRVQQPVCVMVAEPEDWHCRVVVGNDSRQPGRGRCRITDADSGQTLLEAGFAVEANANRDLGRLRVSRGEQRLLLIEWELEAGQGGPGRGGNHYLVGSPPVSLTAYRRWLPRIAGLPLGFAADQAAR